jgi:O-antigen/teichoic acid export membrane protein
MASSWRRVGLPFTVLRVAGQGAEFVGFVVLARRLGAADFGRLSVAFLLCRYAGLVADWGASVRGVRDVAAGDRPEAIHALARRRFLVTLVLGSTYLVVTAGLGRWALAPLVVTIAARGLNRDWLALGRERGARAGLPATVQGLAVMGGALLVHTSRWAAVPIAVGYGAAVVISRLSNPLPHTTSTERVPVDGWLLIAVLADQIVASTDTVLLAVLRSAREAGIYAAVYRIPNAWLTVIGLTVAGMVPATARALKNDPAAVRHLRDRALRIGAFSGAALAATIPVSYFVVPVLFGDAYRPGRVPLMILLAATAVTVAAAPLHPIYISLARDRLQAGISVGAAALNLIANLAVIPLFGMNGAATTTLAAQVFLLVAFWRGVNQAVGRAPADPPGRAQSPAQSQGRGQEDDGGTQRKLR